MQRSPPKLQCIASVLRLSAVVLWMKNALIFRPGEKSWDRKLDKACAFYDSDDDDNALAAEEISDAVADGRMWPALESRGAYYDF